MIEAGTACEQDQDGSILILFTSCQQTCMTYTTVACTVKNSWWWRGNCPNHVEFYSKNKFEKLVHLVGFIIRWSAYYWIVQVREYAWQGRNFIEA